MPSGDEEDPAQHEQSQRRSTRARQVPRHLTDYDYSLPGHSSHSEMASSGTPHALTSVLTNDHFSLHHRHFLAAILTGLEPKSLSTTQKEQCWREAMKAEIGALETNQTWDIVPLPKGKRVVGCKWVYKIKYGSDGSIERYKARLVAKCRSRSGEELG